MKNINDFELTEKVTVGQARKWMTDKDNNSKDKLISLIHHRFTNRYVKHLNNTDSGFLKMAISCLMIETLESFKQGKKDTKGIKDEIRRPPFHHWEPLCNARDGGWKRSANSHGD